MECITTDSPIADSQWDYDYLRSHQINLQTCNFIDPLSADELQQLTHADIIIADAVKLDRARLKRLTRCKAIIRVGDGYDTIDIDYASACGILCCNQPGIWSKEVAEFAYIQGLALLRKIPQLMHIAKNMSTRISFTDMVAQTKPILNFDKIIVGIVGFGKIGQIVCKQYASLVDTFYITDTHQTDASLADFVAAHGLQSTCYACPLTETVQNADILTLHVPGRSANRHLIGAKELQRMKKSAVIVNCSRGSLIDYDALSHALHTDTIAGAALDTTYPEPLPSDHPLFQCKNISITPHFAWYSDSALSRMRDSIVATLTEMAQKKIPPCAINRSALRHETMRLLQ